ncbi:hypothetical protein KY290_006845 [Solanum tuberosum]|uniref:Uncharacterized protein n=1 Tax=Solanum tuberosum TaxID=4113 RepID=A0ABQ7W3X2_SOLTU|nr:hypothetical protein KY284_006883 [Solanum tuberosum]KAH0775434.1 hypothetical protein KY290_006845 [Solanum tuberosum]
MCKGAVLRLSTSILNGKGAQRKKIILEVQHFLEEREGQLALSWVVGEREPRHSTNDEVFLLKKIPRQVKGEEAL